MVIDQKFLIPCLACLTLIFIFINIDLDFKILKNFTFLNKSEESEVKIILLWNKFCHNRALGLRYEMKLFSVFCQVLCSRSRINDDLKFPISFKKLGCPQDRCIITNDRYT